MSDTDYKYCNSLTSYSRFVTREVSVGGLIIGGANPIRVQSMTTTDTMDTKATVEQSIRMIEAGCELVRVTAPSINEAANLENIKKELHKKGYHVPLIADIHYTPAAAELAARIVEKVRVNPGNYADKKKFQQLEYNDAEYSAEIQRIRERFTPLVKICKEYGTAMRIGTNHGSLSDRILSRYGDTPEGMVESAFEFLSICEENNYYNIVLSMKASNTRVMVQAYRLLVNKMIASNRNYPLHLGVTEAGDGEDGRIKSAVGIGALLEDGLGDTVRVSLTEDPEFEIPVARALVERYANRKSHQKINDVLSLPYNPFEYNRNNTCTIENTGNTNPPVIIADLNNKPTLTPAHLYAYGYHYSIPNDKWNLTDRACDYIYYNGDINFELPGALRLICDSTHWKLKSDAPNIFPLYTEDEFIATSVLHKRINFVKIHSGKITSELNKKLSEGNAILILQTDNLHTMAALRSKAAEIIHSSCRQPIVIHLTYPDTAFDSFQLKAATDAGALLLDGLCDGLWLSANAVNDMRINDTAFGILQATRTRISKTEYISCPSCGRTLFDLQETTAKIRAVTDHLKGVKIGIMGCIVNGPGEMADADYGYVGTGPGKITLYKGKEVVKRNVPSDNAVQELINLIKQHGDWVEKT